MVMEILEIVMRMLALFLFLILLTVLNFHIVLKGQQELCHVKMANIRFGLMQRSHQIVFYAQEVNGVNLQICTQTLHL